MERRTLLRLIGLASVQLFSSRLLGQKLSKRKPVIEFKHSVRDVILDQSGIFGHDHSVVGILTCSDVQGTVEAVRRIRKKSEFRCLLRYKSSNRWKAPYAKALIDYWLGSSSIQVRVRAIKQTRKKGEKPSVKDQRYIGQLTALLNTQPLLSNTSRLITQQRHSARQKDVELNRRLKERVGKKDVQVLLIKENQSELIQLLGFVLGTVYGSYEGSEPEDKTKDKTKRDLISYMQFKLDSKSLWVPRRHPRFSVEIVAEA
jgi:hypothetical protein